MKIAPIIRAIEASNRAGHKHIHFRLVHTGQHYDPLLSDIFFRQLQIPEPDANLGVGSGSQAEQTARIMMAFEKELLEYPTDLVVVVGDVNSTMACSIVAKKLHTRVAHVEGGIRSFDMAMPEEINRLVTDSISDYFFTTSHFANTNLRKAGVRDEQIFFVGNTMIDSLVQHVERAQQPEVWDSLRLNARAYWVLTLHRPSNVDDADTLMALLREINDGAGDKRVVFPVHPRTAKVLDQHRGAFPNILLVQPMGYLEFLFLLKNSFAVITDSGGVQEETTFLKIPCLTLRENTERPETVSTGTNVLIGHDLKKLRESLQRILKGDWKQGAIPELWDGRAAERIVTEMRKLPIA
jgi:UDP-N-acetylglucosamine 2-epimerase (non-hydrolysing)